MVAPVIAAAGLSAFGSLAGGAISSGGSRAANRAAMYESHRQYLRQKEFAQHGIRWRVEDAKAAGLHPLYALGGSGASFSPSPAPVFNAKEALGQGVSNAAHAAASVSERSLLEAQVRSLEASTGKDVALGQYYSSLAATGRQRGASANPINFETVALPNEPLLNVRDMGNYFDAAKVEPQSVPSRLSSFPSQTPMTVPGFTEYATSAGPILMPSSNEGMSESMENIFANPLSISMVYQENVRKYGQLETLKRMKALILGDGDRTPVDVGSEYGTRARVQARQLWDWVRQNVLSAPPQYNRR